MGVLKLFLNVDIFTIFPQQNVIFNFPYAFIRLIEYCNFFFFCYFKGPIFFPKLFKIWRNMTAVSIQGECEQQKYLIE